jgi:hypothetical protein
VGFESGAHGKVTEDEGLEVGLLLVEPVEVLDERVELGRRPEVVLHEGVLALVVVGSLARLPRLGHVEAGLLEPQLSELSLLNGLL